PAAAPGIRDSRPRAAVSQSRTLARSLAVGPAVRGIGGEAGSRLSGAAGRDAHGDRHRLESRGNPERLAMSTGMDLVDQLARLAQPWASLYGDSVALQTGITFLHVAGIFLGGGFAIATDRETLMAMRNA